MASASSESEYNDTEFQAFIGRKNLKKRKQNASSESEYIDTTVSSSRSSFTMVSKNPLLSRRLIHFRVLPRFLLFSSNVSIKITVAKTTFFCGIYGCHIEMKNEKKPD